MCDKINSTLSLSLSLSAWCNAIGLQPGHQFVRLESRPAIGMYVETHPKNRKHSSKALCPSFRIHIRAGKCERESGILVHNRKYICVFGDCRQGSFEIQVSRSKTWVALMSRASFERTKFGLTSSHAPHSAVICLISVVEYARFLIRTLWVIRVTPGWHRATCRSCKRFYCIYPQYAHVNVSGPAFSDPGRWTTV